MQDRYKILDSYILKNGSQSQQLLSAETKHILLCPRHVPFMSYCNLITFINTCNTNGIKSRLSSRMDQIRLFISELLVLELRNIFTQTYSGDFFVPGITSLSLFETSSNILITRTVINFLKHSKYCTVRLRVTCP